MKMITIYECSYCRRRSEIKKIIEDCETLHQKTISGTWSLDDRKIETIFTVDLAEFRPAPFLCPMDCFISEYHIIPFNITFENTSAYLRIDRGGLVTIKEVQLVKELKFGDVITLEGNCRTVCLSLAVFAPV